MLTRLWTAIAVSVLLVWPAIAAEENPAARPALRVAIVNTPKFTGLIDALAADFNKATGRGVEIYSGNDVYEQARAGKADLVISHYGKAEVEGFVTQGFGLWPKMVFSNQLAIIGPKSDPAGIKGMTSASAALARIAEKGAPFVANALPGVGYLTDILLAQGKTAKGTWYLDTGVAKGKAIRFAEENSAYVIWGAVPFQYRFRLNHPETVMDLMVTADSLLQRVMAAVVVNPEKVPGADAAGARAFQDYLLEPAVQARIAAHRSEGSDIQLWWPAGRHNGQEGGDD